MGADFAHVGAAVVAQPDGGFGCAAAQDVVDGEGFAEADVSVDADHGVVLDGFEDAGFGLGHASGGHGVGSGESGEVVLAGGWELGGAG